MGLSKRSSVFVVIIVNYYTDKLVRKIAAELAVLDRVFMVIIDNGSNEKIKVTGQKVLYIQNGENVGFAKAVNMGIEAGKRFNPDYYLLLNPDVEQYVNILKSRKIKQFDISSPVIKSKGSRHKYIYDYGGKLNSIISRSYHVHKKIFKQGFYTEKVSLDYVSGCSMVISSRVVDANILFDEHYFLYWEDVDFCLRARQKGFSV